MEDTKKWYMSRTFIGLVVSAVMFTIRLFGVDTDSVDLNTGINVATDIFTYLGLIIAAHGRATATKRIEK